MLTWCTVTILARLDDLGCCYILARYAILGYYLRLTRWLLMGYLLLLTRFSSLDFWDRMTYIVRGILNL
jgi:hypothetical protein